MKRSNRGAARISAVWMISVGVLFLAALAFGFIAQSDLTAEKDKVDSARVAKTDAEARFETVNEVKRDVSEILGWYDRESADPSADAVAATQALEDLRSTFTDLGPTETDYESALPKITAAYNQRGRKVSELETRIQTLQGELTSAQGTTAQVQADKDQLIGNLNQQLADEQQNAAQRQSELEDRLSTAQDQLSERDAELRKVRTDMASAARDYDSEKRVFQTRIAALSDTTRFVKEPFASAADGKIIEVSRSLPVGWIDIGANNRLTRGTRFRVESNTPGNARFKAWAEVTNVEEGRAEVVFSEQVDRFDPVVRGDIVINPLFDPTGGRNAVLAGRFSGEYNKKDLESLLGRMGIHVQPKLELTTHFLIVGSALYRDPETNEPLEEPLEPSELSVYKDAEALSVQIIPLQDIREFFRIRG
jgi:hypothetical protein